MPRPTPPLSATLRALRPALAALVQDIAALAQRGHRRRGTKGVSRKGEGDFVTAIDLRAERILRRELAKLLPSAGFLGEETASRDLDHDFVWVVDPIDGTSNYANGLPHYAVAVALLYRRNPVQAALWCAPEGAMYEAIAGQGAFRNGKRQRIPSGHWDDRTILGCQWHRGQQNLDFLARLQRDGARIRTLGSTVVQLADVACGRLDANVQQQGRIWDLAAPGLLVQEAGGVVTDWQGKALFPLASLDLGHLPSIAASKHVHRKILNRLRGAVIVSPQ
jgi:myo-inositol-1(or 4)-monophosphatase